MIYQLKWNWRRRELLVLEHLEDCPRVDRGSLLHPACWCRPAGRRVRVLSFARFRSWLRSVDLRHFGCGKAGW